MSFCKTTTALLVAVTIALTGCSLREEANESKKFFSKIFDKDTYSIYRPDIQQGNAVSPGQLQRLQIGMSKEQVRYLLGSPITHNVFHKNRWDYYYYLIAGTGRKQYDRVTLFFENDRLSRYCALDKLLPSGGKSADKKLSCEALE